MNGRPLLIIPSTLDPTRRLLLEKAFASRPAKFKLKFNAAGMVKVYDARRYITPGVFTFGMEPGF